MSRILSIHTVTNTSSDHWFDRLTPYDASVIENISDPQGGKTKEPPTSIPSPFARFDLVKTAFARLAKRSNLKGEFNDERLVSEALDVAQIFFNADRFQDRISIVPWSKDIGIDHLKRSQSLGHRRLGKVLELFLQQDGGVGRVIETDRRSGGYNFDTMREIYIMKYDFQGQKGVIGGTSPSTLFFSSPNSTSVQVDIRFGTHLVFGNEPCPLFQRDVDFIQFMFGISHLPDFSKHFPEVSQYIGHAEVLLREKHYEKYKKVGTFEDCLKKYEALSDLTDSLGGHVEVIQGFKVKKVSDKIDVGDFVLETERFRKLYPDQVAPMVLQDGYRGKLKYSSEYWDPKTPVPPFIEEPWNSGRRRLPGLGLAYPWLTINDLFEPVLFKLIYPLSAKHFFDPNESNSLRSESYLIPIKPLFFDFFSAEELASPTRSKVSISIKENKSYVEVSISLKMKEGQPPLVLTKQYLNQKPEFSTITSDSKEGYIEIPHISVNILPFIRIKNADFDPLYHVSLTDNDILSSSISNEFTITFFDESNKKLSPLNITKRSIKEHMRERTVSTHHFSIGNNFDLLRISNGTVSNFLIPKFFDFTTLQGTNKFTVGIDFGTTNTHVEISSDINPTPIALQYRENELMIVSSIHEDGNMEKFKREIGGALLEAPFWRELIPKGIGGAFDISFPIRTVSLESANKMESENAVGGFHKSSPGFFFQKVALIKTNPLVNLKWSKQQKYKDDIEAFLDALLFLARNKIIINSGKLSDTRLIWFYPLSMPSYRRDAFGQIWNKLIQKNFGPNVILTSMLESSAPFYHYRYGVMNNNINASTYPVVNIDIGGETTDIVVYQNNTEVLVTSFRFAANTLFGEGVSFVPGRADDNAFIKKFRAEIEDALNDSSMVDVYNDISQIGRADLLNNFFFSLKSWMNERNKKRIDYHGIIAGDENLRIIFFLFYYAIIYHIAQIFRASSFDFPKHITFSGKGSEIIAILSTSEEAISEMAMSVFEMVSHKDYHQARLKVHHRLEDKKQATSKGGILQLLSRKDGGPISPKNIVKVHSGSEFGFFAATDNLGRVNEELIDLQLNAYQDFLKGIDTLNTKLNLKDTFGILSGKMDWYKEILEKDARDNFKGVLEYRKFEADDADPISETLFFYPIIPAIRNLAYKIVDSE